jgi:peptide/nickel transport system substrate-binding protein
MHFIHKFIILLVITTTVLLSALQSAAVSGQSRSNTPTRKGHLIVALPTEPATLDPIEDHSMTSHRIIQGNVLEGLVKIGRSGYPESLLAERWVVSERGMTYKFYLRKGVKYHNGERFTAVTAKRNLERAMKTNGSSWSLISRIEILDQYRLVVHLNQPYSLFINKLSSGTAVMLPKKGNGPVMTFPVGTGPFKFFQWIRGDRLDLVRNKGYRDHHLPYLEKLTFKFIRDPETRMAALKTGLVHVVRGYSGAPELLQDLSLETRYKSLIGLGTGKVILAFNNKVKPLDDPLVRRALVMAIDREQLIKEAMFGYGQPIGSHWSPVTPYYVDLNNYYPFNEKMARRLLSESGFPDGFETVIKLPRRNTTLQRTGLSLAKMLYKIGIKVKLDVLPLENWQREVMELKNYQLAVVAHPDAWDLGLYADPEGYIGYDSERFRQAYNSALRAQNETEAAEMFGLGQRIISQDAAAGFLFTMPTITIMRSEIMNWPKDNPAKNLDLSEVWMGR